MPADGEKPKKRGGFTSEMAREAGRRGGQMVGRDREHMREIGRRGALARRGPSKEPASGEEPAPVRSDDEPSDEGDGGLAKPLARATG